MKFWRLTCPDYESGDYSHTYINGSLDHPFGLPGVNCDVCGETWSGSRLVPFSCPPALRGLKNIKQGWPIPRADHEVLQRRMMRALRIRGRPFVTLRPGDDFQPAFLDVPSQPRADFIWASQGSLVVSERIKRLLTATCGKDVVACAVKMRKIGKRSAELPPIVPSSGEPEDMTAKIPPSRRAAGTNKYFEIVIRGESDYPAGASGRHVCPGCERPALGRRSLRMTKSMWNGHAIFLMATTLYIIVTDELQHLLREVQPTNVLFKRI